MQRGRWVARRKPKIAWQRMTPAAATNTSILYDTKIVVDDAAALSVARGHDQCLEIEREKRFCIIKTNLSIARSVSVVLTTKTWSGNMWVSVYVLMCVCACVCVWLGVCSGILQGWIWILCLGTKVVQLWHSSCRFQMYLCFYFSLSIQDGALTHTHMHIHTHEFHIMF